MGALSKRDNFPKWYFFRMLARTVPRKQQRWELKMKRGEKGPMSVSFQGFFPVLCPESFTHHHALARCKKADSKKIKPI